VRDYSSTHLTDRELMLDMPALAAEGRANDALLLSRIAEADARKLFLPAGYSSMFSYCVDVLRLSEEGARKRIHAARAARRFPATLPMVADGSLHLSAVVLLAPRLTEQNVDELLAAAAGKSKSEIERLLAGKYPKPDVPNAIVALPAPEPTLVQTGSNDERAPGRVETSGERGHEKPLSAQKFALQLTIGQSTHDKLQYLRRLLRHRIPSGNLVAVVDRALELAIQHVEKRKFGSTASPRKPGRTRANSCHIPAHVRRAVRERDGDQCTFVSESGKRCEARDCLEYDHVVPVARGGLAAVENIRLRCRAHNQFEAERAFGAGFMEAKRSSARRSRSKDAACATVDTAPVTMDAASQADVQEQTLDVISALRNLGVKADRAQRVAEHVETLAVATLEDRIRAALRMLYPRRQVDGAVASTSGAAA
jgi:hypothetical protein